MRVLANCPERECQDAGCHLCTSVVRLRGATDEEYDPVRDLKKEQRFDHYPDSIVPGAGGTSLHLLSYPPNSVFSDQSFDGEAARKEAFSRLPGLADHFEKEDPAMHKTNTVDYAVVYEGEIWLEPDDGNIVHLDRGDVVVQNGTRHAWRNKGTRPVTMLFFLNGANQ
jgi:mannose-6-phosphate isomerase-like protein (cupin superfamily)